MGFVILRCCSNREVVLIPSKMEKIQFKSAIGADHTPQEVASAVLEFMKVDPDRKYAAIGQLTQIAFY